METRRLPPMEGAPTPHPSTAHHAPPYRQPGPPPAPPPHPPPPGSINTKLPSVAATFNPQHHSATAPSSLPPYPRDRINTDAQERATHEYKYEYNRSQHGTPVNRLPPDPYPRTPSTPAPPSIPPPPGGLPERPPMEGPHPGYGPDHYAPQYMHHGPPPPEHMMAHQTEPMYHHAPHGYQMLYNPTVAVNAASAASLANRKKSMRASQACDKCRERKSKCDEQRPCTTCKENNYECHYKDAQPSKTEKTSVAVTDALEKVSTQLESLAERMNALENIMTGQAKSEPLADRTKSQRESAEPGEVDMNPKEEQDENREEEERRLSIDKQVANFDEHITGPHNLFWLWPSIADIFREHTPGNSNYPTKLEARGPLRLYGCGEGEKLEESIALGAASPAQSTTSDENPGTSSPSEGPWGSAPAHATIVAPNTATGEIRRSEPLVVTESTPNLEIDTIYRLYNSYKEHIYKLHPFLDLPALTKLIDSFIRRYSPQGSSTQHSLFVNTNSLTDNGFQRPNKRQKRSEGPGASSNSDSGGSNHSLQFSHRPFERSISNAIIFLILALGKVCEHPGPLPGLVPDEKSMGPPSAPSSTMTYPPTYSASPATTKPSPSSPHSSTFSSSTPPGAYDSVRHGVRSRRSSMDGSSSTGRREVNADKIPGLSYYREACAILGDFADSNELSSAQARLLAGLYKGQLARVQESWSWIQQASRTCQLRIRLEGMHKHELGASQPANGKDKTTLLLVYWSCLQLESDILAELDYPHSGLSRYEERLPLPGSISSEQELNEFAGRSGVVEKEKNGISTIMAFYSAQVFLRKRLNRIHAAIYGASVHRTTATEMANILSEHVYTLEDFRQLDAQPLRWDDADPPATDVLRARLRGKYYGARYVISRPFLDYALHIMDRGGDLEQLTVDTRQTLRKTELAVFRGISILAPKVIKEQVQICIDCAMRSTVAFDGVPNRLIVTNPMGTAHAQFGNMLILAAAYNSQIPWVNALVPQEKFEALLTRTINFLRKLWNISETIKEDIGHLEKLQQLFRFKTTSSEVARSDIRMYNSFSSDA